MKLLLGGLWKCQKWGENANQTQLKPIIWYTSWKLPKKWGNRPKKEETDQQTENLKLFLKTGNWPNKRGNRPKKRGNRPKKRGNWSTNWEFTTFLKTGNKPKKWGNRPKKRGNRPKKQGNWLTNWEFTTFFKTGNGPKKWGNGPKKRGNRSTNWELKFFWKPEMDPKNEETDRKYWEILQKYKTPVNLNPT